VYNRAHLPVPLGFAITAYGYQLFLDYNELTELIQKKLKDLDINDTDALMAVSQELQNRIVDADLPADLEASILQAARDLKAHLPHDFKLSVRSSATSEDSEASFAGQHATVLNVSEANLVEAYKDVVASTFSPRAIYYRRRRGYRDQDVNMSVACIVMIHAKVSGVMYTVDPNDSRHAVIMISAVWGLAADAVDGSAATDFYQVDKKTLALEASEIALKERRLKPDAADGVLEEDLPEDLKRAACLTGEEIRLLADYAVRLENHYGYALDIEWVIDRQGKLYILQARPLKRSQRFGAEDDRSNFEKTGLQGGTEERHGPGRDEEISGGSPPGAAGPSWEAVGIGAPARHAPLRRPPDRLVRGAVPERKLPVCLSRGMTIRWHG
jgi:pyruvate,water dikinase